MEPVRPTLRCLRNDLKLALPPATQPLDEVDHPLLAKARAQFADGANPHERIARLRGIRSVVTGLRSGISPGRGGIDCQESDN